MTRRSARCRFSGSALIYSTIAIFAIAGMVSLSVDWGRVLLVRSELRAAADAAACAAVMAIDQGVNATIARAKAAAAENRVDGSALVLLDSDIEFGEWDDDTRTFSVLTGTDRADADAIRIRAVRSDARGNAVPLMFATLVGKSKQDVAVSSTATYASHVTDSFVTAASKTIATKASPWNAGLPNGITWGDFQDTTPNCSPVQVTEIAITPGQPYVFRAGTSSPAALEGDVSTILDQTAQNGFGRTRAPANALMGVFLTDADPRSSSTPSQRNYTKASKRDFGTHRPKLKQPFFIGDGMNSKDAYQEFIPPLNATRLFLGIMDERGRWSDNTGSINIEIGYPEDNVPSGASPKSNSTRIVE